jgi:hypothetical protein
VRARGREDERKVPGRWGLRKGGCFTAEDPNTVASPVVCHSIDSRGEVGLCCSQSRRRAHSEISFIALMIRLESILRVLNQTSFLTMHTFANSSRFYRPPKDENVPKR